MNARKIECRNRVAAIAFLVSMTASAVCLSSCSQPKQEQVEPVMDPRGFRLNPDLSKPSPKYLDLTKAGENYFDELKKRPSTFDHDFTEAQASGKKPKLATFPGGLQIQEIEEGWGLTPKPGGVTLIHYTGWLSDGTEFDSSTKKGKPFKFVYGKGEVIIGLEQGVKGMKVGGTRVLVIPPNLAYGAKSAGNIPANATLTYKIKLLSTGKGFE